MKNIIVMMTRINNMEYENCKYYTVEDTTPWHGDVFDHPEYKYFCSKNDRMKEIIPFISCKRCINKSRNERVEKNG